MPEAIAVGVREFRENLSRFLAEAGSGKRVSITSHGKPIAELIGPSGDRNGASHRRIGGLKHLGPIPDGFDDFDEELDEMFHGKP